MKTKIIAEIGLNHNGDMEIAKKLIDLSSIAGCDIVKFQKRTIDVVYTQEFLASKRESPFGTTQREQKEGLEFSFEQYEEIDRYCKEKNIEWTASAWDMDSQKFLQKFDVKYNKIASAMLGDEAFLNEVASEKRYTFISTGMCTMEEIDFVVDIFKKHNCEFELLHCNSTYPMEDEDANLLMINTLRDKYNVKVGYSGHERGINVSLVAVALGASTIERHITLDKNMYGSDQKASIEPDELIKMVKEIKNVEKMLGDGVKNLSTAEQEVRTKLRG